MKLEDSERDIFLYLLHVPLPFVQPDQASRFWSNESHNQHQSDHQVDMENATLPEVSFSKYMQHYGADTQLEKG